ncbi:hypothetical protein NPIL_467791 [Nephila pilipes]|uniref:Uncharacterized protein n=1 Tax=Nephila pilipes TaxID=299642 RepID=A0A8X6PJR4_NEPPI|nr:hypothetical protein NPIL_467791 [Nephila pilipes]
MGPEHPLNSLTCPEYWRVRGGRYFLLSVQAILNQSTNLASLRSKARCHQPSGKTWLLALNFMRAQRQWQRLQTGTDLPLLRILVPQVTSCCPFLLL